MSRALANALLMSAAIAVALLALEIGLRLRPSEELPLNNPYQLTRLIGSRQFRVPFHSYREIYPLQLDHGGYYARSDGAIDYHFDQTGGRWIEPRARDLAGDIGIVVGDSFTLGFGLRYEDAYVFKVEQTLREHGRPRHLLNFAEPGAEARISLRNYLAVRGQQPHDLVLYGLHLNDLIQFTTSYVAMAGTHRRDTVAGLRLLGFVARRLVEHRDRRARIQELTDPAQLQRPRFRDNMDAIEALSHAASERGRRFFVVILPILVDLRAGTFAPVYAAIRESLTQRGIRYIDVSASLAGNSDASLWILPFDQHPNERANDTFAHVVAAALLAEP